MKCLDLFSAKIILENMSSAALAISALLSYHAESVDLETIARDRCRVSDRYFLYFRNNLPHKFKNN